MNTVSISEAAKAVVRRNTDEVQGRGNFDVFEEIFADDFVDHTTQPGTSPDKTGVRKLYTYFVKRSRISTRKSTGSSRMAIVLRPTRRITAPTRARILESLRPIARFSLRRLMSCASRMERSPITGAWQIFCP